MTIQGFRFRLAALAAGALIGLSFPALAQQPAADPALIARAEAGDLAAMREVGAQFVKAQLASRNEAEERRNEAEAIRWFRTAADRGDGAAMHLLGVVYASREVGEAPPPPPVAPGEVFDRVAALLDDDERDLTQDPNMMEAVRWFRRSAEAGNAKGMFALGTSYADGTGVRPNEAEAVRWLSRAAELGDTDAMVNMGFYYSRGTAVRKDEAEAIRWYRLAADKGNPIAMFTLGVKYHMGETGLPKNLAEALRWERMAADKGYAPAMFSIGHYYENGEGVPKSEAEALRWYRMAAEAGSREAGEYLRQRGL